MRGVLPKSWSIGRRLAFLYTLTICTLLVISGLLLDWLLRTDLTQEDKVFLATQIQSIKILLSEYPDDRNTLEAEIGRDTKASASTFARYYVRITDKNGKTIVETTGMPISSGEPLKQNSDGVIVEGIDYAVLTANNGIPFLLAQAPSANSDQTHAGKIIQVALDMSHEAAIINSYRQKVALVVIGGIVLSLLLSLFITKEGLDPLKRLVYDVRDITPDRLQVRVGSREWPKEIGVLAHAFDAMMERLELSFTSISQFSADLAHELRTPINNLRGEAEVALSKARTAEEYRQILMSSLEEYERLSRMIENILFLARSDSKKQKLNLLPLNISQEVGEVLEYYDALREEKGISINVSVGGVLSADKTLFRRAIANVISNALQYTEPGGNISVSSQIISQSESKIAGHETQGRDSSASAIEITISDNGIGIDTEDLPRIFDRFYRARKARSVYSQGTGLGFSIVKSIMELHNGSIQVTSTPGSGTTVKLVFPKTSSAEIVSHDDGVRC